jgi:hypothetical protein
LVIGREEPREEMDKKISTDEVITHTWDKYMQAYTCMHWRFINTKGEAHTRKEASIAKTHMSTRLPLFVRASPG